jgi:hypothetical protein
MSFARTMLKKPFLKAAESLFGRIMKARALVNFGDMIASAGVQAGRLHEIAPMGFRPRNCAMKK